MGNVLVFLLMSSSVQMKNSSAPLFGATSLFLPLLLQCLIMYLPERGPAGVIMDQVAPLRLLAPGQILLHIIAATIVNQSDRLRGEADEYNYLPCA